MEGAADGKGLFVRQLGQCKEGGNPALDRRITALAEALEPLGFLLADPNPRAQTAQKIRKDRIVGDGQIRPLKLIDGIKGERAG